jgi:hypothetical protein
MPSMFCTKPFIVTPPVEHFNIVISYFASMLPSTAFKEEALFSDAQ